MNRNELRDEVLEIFFAIEIRAGFNCECGFFEWTICCLFINNYCLLVKIVSSMGTGPSFLHSKQFGFTFFSHSSDVI